MREPVKGLLAIITASFVWGLSPLFYKSIAHIPPLEVQSHRIIWSLVFFGTMLILQNRPGEVFRLLAQGRMFLLVLFSASMISVNWLLFIWSIQVGRTVETSLGYYIFPLVAVVLGALIFGERLGGARLLAVGLAVVAVLILSLGLGTPPWVSLVLAFTFGMYGAAKKSMPAGPVVSVTAEVVILAPLALIWLYGVHFQGWNGIVARPGAVFGTDLGDSLMLMASGPITATPLVLFSYASRRVSLTTVGLVQYINPTLQFACAVLVFGEVFSGYHAVTFVLIWLSLAIYSTAAIRQDRAARRALPRVSTSSQTTR